MDNAGGMTTPADRRLGDIIHESYVVARKALRVMDKTRDALINMVDDRDDDDDDRDDDEVDEDREKRREKKRADARYRRLFTNRGEPRKRKPGAGRKPATKKTAAA